MTEPGSQIQPQKTSDILTVTTCRSANWTFFTLLQTAPGQCDYKDQKRTLPSDLAVETKIFEVVAFYAVQPLEALKGW